MWIYDLFTVELLCKNYKRKGDQVTFRVDKHNKHFESAYNTIQDQLRTLAGRDELLCGM